MKIEFSFPHGEVPGLVIEFVKNKLLEYHRDNKEVADAEVVFRQGPDKDNSQFICRIVLSLFGETLLVQRDASSYLKAARDVMKEIETRLEDVLKRISEPPQEITSTISV